MLSNGVLSSEIDTLNEKGILSKARWAGTGLSLSEPGRPGRLQTGAAVFRAQCASCHTLDGYLGIRKIVEPADMDILNMILSAMKDDGLKRKQIAAGETVVPDYILMPPFVGTEHEKEALAEYLDSLKEPSRAH
jgi:mono/diheme cytochrome c family protein